jgi:hypothetical protein
MLTVTLFFLITLIIPAICVIAFAKQLRPRIAVREDFEAYGLKPESRLRKVLIVVALFWNGLIYIGQILIHVLARRKGFPTPLIVRPTEVTAWVVDPAVFVEHKDNLDLDWKKKYNAIRCEAIQACLLRAGWRAFLYRGVEEQYVQPYAPKNGLANMKFTTY